MRKYMSKRQRPCDICRSRKTACRIEDAPPCRECRLHQRECTFLETTRPRKKAMSHGLPLSEGVHDAASTASPDAQANTGDADAIMTATANMSGAPWDAAADDGSFADMSMQFWQDLDVDMDSSEYQLMFRTPSRPASRASVLGNTTGSGSVPVTSTSSPPSPASSQPFLDGQASTNPEALGLTGDMDPYLLQQYQTGQDGIFKFKQLAVRSVQQQPVPVQFLLSRPALFARSREQAGNATSGDAHSRTQLEQLVPLSTGKRLISLYQRFVAPQYPIFSATGLPDPASSLTHLLAAVYAIAVPFAMHDDKLCIDLAYDAFPYPALLQVLNTSLAADLHSPNLATVQTALLLVLRPPSNPLVSEASHQWNMMGNLVTAAVNIGLHLDPTSWNLPTSEISLRRRISFLIFSADRWLASSFGRPPLINDANWLVVSLSPADDLGCGLSDADWAQLLRWSSLTGVLDSSLTNLYSLRSLHCSTQNPDQAVNVAMALSHRLVDECLLADRYGTPSQASSSSMNQAVIRLGNHYTDLIILRAALRPLLHTKSRSTSASDDSSPAQSIRESMRDCIKQFLGCITNLRIEETDGIWPPWAQPAISTLCFTVLTMIISTSHHEEALEWIKLLQLIRHELRLKAASFSVLRLALLRIDSIFWRGVENVLQLPPHVHDAFASLQETS